MFINLGFYKRKPGLGIEEFRQKWSVEYGALYRHPDITRYLRRYVQHRLSPQTDWNNPFVGFDGFSESWFDSPEARREMQSTEYYKNVLAPKAAEFIDWENSKLSAYDDQVVQVGGRALLHGEG